MRLCKATLDQLEILLFVHDRAAACLPVALISKHLELPAPISNKLVTRLTRAKLLRARRGPGGGVLLARPAASMPLGSTIRRLEKLNRKDALLADGGTRIERYLSGALNEFLGMLDGFTLADLTDGWPRRAKLDRRARERVASPRLARSPPL